MKSDEKQFYETGNCPPLGAYICAQCEKDTVYITKEGEKLPLCRKCGNIFWNPKVTSESRPD